MYINGSIKSIGTIAEFILYVNMLTACFLPLGWVAAMKKNAQRHRQLSVTVCILIINN
jgi:ATP-binding cassette subfamily B protein